MDLRQNVRYALRGMRRSPVFTLTVLLTLGIGIGANTAIFSFVDRLLVRPLPYPGSDRIVTVWQDYSTVGGPAQEWSTPPDFRDIGNTTTLAATTALVNWQPTLTGEGEAERLAGGVVSPGWFDVLGVDPALGRRFTEEDAAADASIVVLSHGLPRDNLETPSAWYRQVTPGYLDAIGIRLLRGRAIEPGDREGAPATALVNETLARRWWPDGDAIGARISPQGPDGPWTTIVGIVADVRQLGPGHPARGELYLPLAQVPSRGTALVVRTAGDPLSALPAVRAAVRDIDPDVPVANVSTMEESVRQTMAIPRLYISFFTFFALVALILAAMGIYGVTAHAVTQRTPEIGVRMALGAATSDVLKLVLRQGLGLVLAGLGAGLLLALALSRLLASLLFDLSPTDPLTFAAIAALLAVVALVAILVPAARAAHVDPLRALRTDA